jgi:O-antigen/teichoic acid export membrane protein
MSLAFGEIASKAIGFLVMAYLARTLGTAGFGKFSFAQAIVIYFVLLINLGLDLYGTRQIARSPSEGRTLVDHLLTLRVLAAVVSYSILLVLIWLMPKDMVTKQLLVYLGLLIFAFSFNLEWFFQGLERMHYISLSRISRAVFYALFIFIGVKGSDDVLLVGILFTASSFLAAFLLFGIFIKQNSLPRFHVDWKAWQEMLKISLPMGFSLIMITIYHNLDSVMLGFMKSDEVVGWYNAAYKIIIILTLPATLLHSVFLPALSRTEDWSKIKQVAQNFLKVSFLLGIPIGFGGLVLSQPLTLLVFGDEYANSIIPLQILTWNATLIFINVAYGIPLLVWGKEKKFTLFVALGAAVNLTLNFLLIPPYGMVGAALATIIAELTVFFGVYREFQKLVSIPFFGSIQKPLIASLGMLIGLTLCVNLVSGFFTLFLIGTLIYFGIMVALRGITVNDFRVFLKSRAPSP